MCLIIPGWEDGCRRDLHAGEQTEELLTAITLDDDHHVRDIWMQVLAQTNSSRARLLMYFSKAHHTQKFSDILNTGKGGGDVNDFWSFWLFLGVFFFFCWASFWPII